jgi:hypothetical protein
VSERGIPLASDTQRLEQAVAAYRAALEVWSRSRAPLNWAMAQANLGNALVTLGEREGGEMWLTPQYPLIARR